MGRDRGAGAASSCGATRSSPSTTETVDRIGLEATRVTDVAKALNVSPALIFYHFGTKDALVAEAFAYAVERDLRPPRQGHGRRHRPGRQAAPGAALLRPDRPGEGLADLDRRLGAGPARAGDPQGAAADGPPLVRGAARRSSTRASPTASFTLPRPGRHRGAGLGAASTGSPWPRWSTARSPAPSCAAGWRRRSRASSGIDQAAACREDTSHQPVGGVGGIGQGRAVQPEVA